MPTNSVQSSHSWHSRRNSSPYIHPHWNRSGPTRRWLSSYDLWPLTVDTEVENKHCHRRYRSRRWASDRPKWPSLESNSCYEYNITITNHDGPRQPQAPADIFCIALNSSVNYTLHLLDQPLPLYTTNTRSKKQVTPALRSMITIVRGNQ